MVNCKSLMKEVNAKDNKLTARRKGQFFKADLPIASEGKPLLIALGELLN